MREKHPSGYEAWQLMARGPSTGLYRPSIFADAIAGGIEISLHDAELDNKVQEGFREREKFSGRLGREDSVAYMAGFIAHILAYQLRQTEEEETHLASEASREREGATTELTQPTFWHNTITEAFTRLEETNWHDLAIKDTQTVVEERGKGVIAGLRAMRALQQRGFRNGMFEGVEFDNLKILDIGGSAGFTNLPILDSDEFGVSSVTIADNYDGMTLVDTLGPWIRSNSTPLDSLSLETLEAFKEREARILKLYGEGRLSFARTVSGSQPIDRVASKVKDVDGAGKLYNIAVCSTMLHQLTHANRSHIFSSIKEIMGNDPTWGLVINDFAALRPLLRDSLKYLERWHTGSHPYRTFIGGRPSLASQHIHTGKQRLFEVGRWDTSRCGSINLSANSVVKDLRLDDLQSC